MSSFACAGVGINTLNLEVMPLDEVSRAVSESAGFVIGSPTLGGHMPTQVNFPLCLAVSLATPRSSTNQAVWQSMGQGHTPIQVAPHLQAFESDQPYILIPGPLLAGCMGEDFEIACRCKQRWGPSCGTLKPRICPAGCLAALAGAERLLMSWRSA